jgi:uncharacterized protein (TIGR02145 family)
MIGICLFFIVSCKKDKEDEIEEIDYKTGLLIPTQEEFEAVGFVEDMDTNNVLSIARIANVSSYVLNMPSVGNQMVPTPYNSCVGWSLGHGLIGYHYSKIKNTAFNGGSPAFIWNQLNGLKNEGISIISALQLLKTFGVCENNFMSPVANYTSQPSSAAIQNAKKHTISFYKRFIDVNITLMKSFLSKGYPLPIGVSIDRGFEKRSDDSYVNVSGTKVYKYKSGGNSGLHAMLIIGYDDALSAFKVMNSWGTNWGDGGYVWIDYELMKDIIFKPYFGQPELYFVVPRIVLTKPVTNIGNTNATINGNVVVSGGSNFFTVTERGFCYGRANNEPTIDSTKIINGSGIGEFTTNISNLTPNKKYYVRTYAVLSNGDLSYGNLDSLTTNCANISFGADMDSDGTIAIFNVQGGTPPYQFSVDNSAYQESNFFVGSYQAGEAYIIKIKDANDCETSELRTIDEYTFSCGSTIYDIDGNEYPTVEIGSQCWTQTNLETTRFSDGSVIAEIENSSQWGSTSSPARSSVFNNLSEMYNGYVVTDSRNVCPIGWHVPSNAEWDILTNYLGGINVAGGKIKSLIHTNYSSNSNTIGSYNAPNVGATNESGFTGRPDGYLPDYSINSLGDYQYGCWWSSTPLSSQEVIGRWVENSHTFLTVIEAPNNSGFNIRCVKD